MNQPPQEVVWNIPQSFDGLMQCGPQLLQPAIHHSLSRQFGHRLLPMRSMDIWHHPLEPYRRQPASVSHGPGPASAWIVRKTC